MNIEELYEQYKPMVISAAKKFYWVDSLRDRHYEDLIAEGELGLIIALNKLDGSRVTSPSSYVYPYILGYMHRYVNSYIFSMPHNTVSLDSPVGEEDMCYADVISDDVPEYSELNTVEDIINVFYKWVNSSISSEKLTPTIRKNLNKNKETIRRTLELKSKGVSTHDIEYLYGVPKTSVNKNLGYIHMCLEQLHFIWAENN